MIRFGCCLRSSHTLESMTSNHKHISVKYSNSRLCIIQRAAAPSTQPKVTTPITGGLNGFNNNNKKKSHCIVLSFSGIEYWSLWRTNNTSKQVQYGYVTWGQRCFLFGMTRNTAWYGVYSVFNSNSAAHTSDNQCSDHTRETEKLLRKEWCESFSFFLTLGYNVFAVVAAVTALLEVTTGKRLARWSWHTTKSLHPVDSCHWHPPVQP